MVEHILRFILSCVLLFRGPVVVSLSCFAVVVVFQSTSVLGSNIDNNETNDYDKDAQLRETRNDQNIFDSQHYMNTNKDKTVMNFINTVDDVTDDYVEEGEDDDNALEERFNPSKNGYLLHEYFEEISQKKTSFDRDTIYTILDGATDLLKGDYYKQDAISAVENRRKKIFTEDPFRLDVVSERINLEKTDIHTNPLKDAIDKVTAVEDSGSDDDDEYDYYIKVI